MRKKPYNKILREELKKQYLSLAHPYIYGLGLSYT